MDNEDSNNSNASVIDISPGMTKYYIPHCDPSLKPQVGQIFHSIDEAVEFYKQYALTCGFDVRLGTTVLSDDRTCIIWKYVYCNREGVKNAKASGEDNISRKRRTVSNRVDCKARVAFRFMGSKGYVIQKFIDRHTHSLVPESYKHFMKMNNTLDYGHKNFLLQCAKVNIGPAKSFRLLKEAAGSYSNVGCTSIQVKNFKRDLKAYVIGVDAQIGLDNLHKKREVCRAFFFEFEVDGNDHLKSLFWADPIARRNFSAFGDVISFDATYGTNKYGMIFTPFTGKDNHGRCITLGAALMTGESIISYSWVFKQFIKCMGHGPSILMTDQDPAIKVAVEDVLVGTKHRLCMWHIMNKIPEKAPIHLKKDPTFMKQLSSLVWSVHVEQNDFDERWKQTMIDFGLTNDAWFNFMFDIRDSWIPAYFRDFPMGGLFRTTSPSESENSFFHVYINDHSNLVELFMYYNSAMDSQRHSQTKLDHEDLSCHHDMKTLFSIEKHAATVYTRHIFNEVQNDIEIACYKCRLKNIKDEELRCLYEIEHRDNGVFSVTYDKVDQNVVCSCKKFMRIGLLCSHAYFVLKDLNIEDIPEKYIISHWTKLALSTASHIVASDVRDSCSKMKDNRLILQDTISEFYDCMGLVDGDHDKSQILLQAIRDIRDVLKLSEENISSESVKKRLFDQFYHSTLPEVVSVKSPLPVKTKGSGSRLKSRREKAIKQIQKPLRMCSKCNKMSHHDARNCNNFL